MSERARRGLLNLPTPNRYKATKAFMEWYDAEKRRRPLRGLEFFSYSKGSPGSILIASRHWRHSITWSWLLRFNWTNVGYWWKPRAWWHFAKHNGGGQGRITPWLHFAWQDEMPSAPKNYRAERDFIEALRTLPAEDADV